MAYELEQFEIKVILIEPWVIKTNLEIKLGIRVSSTHSDNANSPYGEMTGKRIAVLKSSFEISSSSPIEVAKVVLKAIISGKPYLGCLIGDDLLLANRDKKEYTSDKEFRKLVMENILK